MLEINSTIQNALNSPVREINGKVEHFRNSTLLNTFYKNTSLQKIEIQRVAENSRFFGMVICHRINVKLRDVDRTINIRSGDKLIPYLGTGDQFIHYPTFTITEVNRNENTNQLSITGYDFIDKLKEHTVEDLNITPPYTIAEFMTAIANFMGTTYRIVNVSDMFPFNLNYTNGANFEGSETLSDAVQRVAEATQTVIFADSENRFVLKRLSPNEVEKMTITKSLYTKLSSKTNRRLVGVCSQTDLGDNVESKLEQSGTTQNVVNNPFWELREDIGDIVDNALSAVGGLTLNQFSCSWIGNLFLEIGDKIAITTKDNGTVYSYILDDTITFDGGLEEKTQWDYIEDETALSNSSSIGDVLKQTYARVDKQGKEIILLASDVEENAKQIGQLKITTNSISAEVSSYQSNYNQAINNLNGELQEIRNAVSAQMTETQIRLAISEAVENSVNKVETETGFTFDKDGLSISKSDSEMRTVIDEDGMRVYKNNEEVLIANNQGVNAINLTARQYLIVGLHSRFEDFGNSRTGCFWIE